MPTKKPTKGQALSISARDWSRMLDIAGEHDQSRLGKAVAPSFAMPPTQALNSTGADVAPLGVMAINSVAFTPTESEADFNRGRFIFKSTATPSRTTDLGRFVIAAEAIPDGEIGRVWCDGVCPANIDIDADWHRYADVQGEAGAMLAYPGGGAEILYKSAATGDDTVCIIRFGPTPFVTCEFTLGAALATTDASKSATIANANIYGYASASITVYNHAASSNYIFEGASGAKGTATYDAFADKWRIKQMECP